MRPALASCIVVSTAVLALGALAPAPASARKSALRKEVEQLRAQLTELRLQVGQLQSAMASQSKRFDGAPGASLPPGGGGGSGICADPCQEDSDGDGLGDCEDPCLCDPAQTDGDADGTPDCLDPCPDDAGDACIDPCRFDSDGDGTNDCEDPCPWDPLPPEDRDANGVVDCVDLCWLLAAPTGVEPGSPLPCPILVPPPGSPTAP
jgi:hypothetical protein